MKEQLVMGSARDAATSSRSIRWAFGYHVYGARHADYSDHIPAAIAQMPGRSRQLVALWLAA